jgi:hypothetical protein
MVFYLLFDKAPGLVIPATAGSKGIVGTKASRSRHAELVDTKLETEHKGQVRAPDAHANDPNVALLRTHFPHQLDVDYDPGCLFIDTPWLKSGLND